MAKQLTTEKEIKKALKVKSFSELPLDKYDDLAQLLVNTKKDVAIGIINQLPEYMTYAKEMLSKLTEVCQGVLSEGKSAHNDTINAYMVILNNLSKELETKKLTKRRKKKITEQMMLVAEKIAKEGEEHRNFVLNVFKTFGQIGVAVGTLALAVVVIAKETIKK